MITKLDCCPNCFSAIGNVRPCPYCGYEKFERKYPLALPVNLVLNHRYIAGKELGAGGFGITYQSFDMKRKQICAIKEYVPINCAVRKQDTVTLSAMNGKNRETYNHGMKKFLGEANTLRRLHDIPDVVQIWDCFEENGTAYFVMEYVPGVTLNKMRANQGGRISYQLAYEVIIKAARCLDRIHKEGNIFHRDISPENIMITPEGKVKVIDFGTAKYIHGKRSQSLSVVLKPGYAPWEQYSTTSKQGSFTDVYALAATFYYILTESKIPPAPDRIGDSEKNKIVPLETYSFLGPDYKELTKILDNALKVKHTERTQTMGEFVAQLEEYNKIWWGRKGQEDKKLSEYTGDLTMPVTVGPDQISEEKSSTDKSTEPISGISENRSIQVPLRHPKIYPYLEGRTEEIVGSRYYIPVNTMITVGRSETNNIVIKISVVGREHLDVFYDIYSNMFFIMDKNSVNHTYINGKRCEAGKIYPAEPGSLLSLARDACVFQLGVVNE